MGDRCVRVEFLVTTPRAHGSRAASFQILAHVPTTAPQMNRRHSKRVIDCHLIRRESVPRTVVT